MNPASSEESSHFQGQCLKLSSRRSLRSSCHKFPSIYALRVMLYCLLQQSVFSIEESVQMTIIIIDAGSTGTRLVAYKFIKSYRTNDLRVLDEFLNMNDKGLSEYVNDPGKGAEMIMELVDGSREYIPEDAHKRPILLRATAGLRLLPAQKATALLEACSRRLAESGFSVDSNTSAIIDEPLEGIFSWYTVNLLEDNFAVGRSTYPTLDLGGASLEVTFEQTPQYAELLPQEYLFVVETPKRNVTVYTRSFLKLGLNAFRQGVWLQEMDNSITTNGQPSNVTSVCVNPEIKNAQFVYQHVRYSISGAPSPRVQSVDADHCSLVQDELLSGIIQDKASIPKLPSEEPIAAISYFTEIVASTKKIDSLNGGTIQLSDLKEILTKSCQNPETDRPFTCFDAIYMDLLMRDLLGLKENTILNLYKKIKGHEISWALGLAYNTLTNGIISMLQKS